MTVPFIDVNETVKQARIDLGETLLTVKEILTFQPDAFNLWSDDRLLIGDTLNRMTVKLGFYFRKKLS